MANPLQQSAHYVYGLQVQIRPIFAGPIDAIINNLTDLKTLFGIPKFRTLLLPEHLKAIKKLKIQLDYPLTCK